MTLKNLLGKHYQNNLILAGCMLILGMLLIFQYKTALTQHVSTTGSSFVSELNDLNARLQEEIDSGTALLEQNKNLNQEYDKLINDYVNDIKDEDLGAELELLVNYRVYAGMTDVKGKGLIITMKDAKVANKADPSLFLIHDMDILRVLNVLKSSGALAISINGERILPSSEIMCAGPTVRINRNRYPVPYVINVIGDPGILSSALQNSLIYQLLKDYDISITIEEKQELIVKKYFENIDWTINALSEVNE